MFLGRVHPNFDQVRLAAFHFADPGRHDKAAALTDHLTQLDGEVPDFLGGAAIQQRIGHAAGNTHGVSQDFLHLEDVAPLEPPHRLSLGQFGQVPESLIPDAFIEDIGHDPLLHEPHHQGLELGPVKFFELGQRHETIRATVQRNERNVDPRRAAPPDGIFELETEDLFLGGE